MFMRFLHYILVIIVIFSFSAKAEDFEGQSLALPCLGCHGNTTDSSIPVIFGLNQDYIYLNLIDYKQDKRKHYLMQLISKGYSNDQLMLLARYFSKAGKKDE